MSKLVLLRNSSDEENGGRMRSRRSTSSLQRGTDPARSFCLARVSALAGGRQAGAFAIMFIPLLIVMIGFCGLAIDMGQLYNRKADMQGIARAAALAAARQLDGTPEGIAAAKAAARSAVEKLYYRNFTSGLPVSWDDNALSFGTSSSRSGTWTSALVAGGNAAEVANLFFARVDTAGLSANIGKVETYFVRIFNADLASMQVSESAIAGRTSLKAAPIGICAMSPAPAAAREATRANGSKVYELVEYGFRRGVSYDLMRLNPTGTEPRRFTINPVAEPGTTSPEFNDAALRPFACQGSMWIKRLGGGAVRVSELPQSSPLASLRAALNTRFDLYGDTPCTPSGAGPDINIKSYAYDQTNVVRWMSPNKGSAVAAETTERGKLETVADLSSAASPETYGPLWAYARAVKLSSATDFTEPPNGYATFEHTDWPTLYPSGPTASSYPSQPSTPYFSGSTSSGYYQAPRTANRPMQVPKRRVLHIPLLSCTSSAPSGANAQASVAAVARFFMTVPATDNNLIAEFAGAIPPQAVPGHVELFP